MPIILPRKSIITNFCRTMPLDQLAGSLNMHEWILRMPDTFDQNVHSRPPDKRA